MTRTDSEVEELLQSNNRLAYARALFSSQRESIDAAIQEGALPVQIRRMELESIEQIAEFLGVQKILDKSNRLPSESRTLVLWSGFEED